jgi:hypothetical protein
MAAISTSTCRYGLISALTVALLCSAVGAIAQQQPATDSAQVAADQKTADDAAKAKAAALAHTRSLPECSVAKTNSECKLIIDRARPVAPPAIQMYSNQKLTVVVVNAKTFERYFLDYQSGQAALTPDVASSIVQGLLPALGKVAEIESFDGTASRNAKTDQCDVSAITDTAVPTAGSVGTVIKPVLGCLEQLSGKAIGIYRSLEPFVAPDSLVPDDIGPKAGTDDKRLLAISNAIAGFLKSEFLVSTRISAISGDPGLKTTADLKLRNADARAILELTDLQKPADAVANDLLAYRLRIKDVVGSRDGIDYCSAVIDFAKEEKNVKPPPVDCAWITSRADDDKVYDKMVTRTITYFLNTLNMVSNSQEAVPDQTKKKLMATIAINFADSREYSARSALRWEASAGAFFSTLPVRSFSVKPIFTNGVITNKVISQNILHPTVVPFAAANYRLSNDLSITRWKSNIYWTGAVGINPNTVTADFATGLSYSFRALMVSALAHFGHDVTLTQGLTVGQSLGASFNGTLPTQTHWTTSFAVGVSVRIPALTGR